MANKLKKHLSKYARIPNSVLCDKELTLKAKGLYALIESKPENWSFSAKGLSSQTKESVDAVSSALKELEERGWLKREKYQDNAGHWCIDYHLYETQGEPENPDLENPIQENPYTGKSLNIVRKTKKERLKKEILKNTAKAGSREDPVSKAYYEAIKSLALPVTNHTVIRAKIKEMKSLYSEEQCIWYLNFMKNDYASWQTKYKPQVTQAIDIYSKSNAIIKRLVEDNKKAEVF